MSMSGICAMKGNVRERKYMLPKVKRGNLRYFYLQLLEVYGPAFIQGSFLSNSKCNTTTHDHDSEELSPDIHRQPRMNKDHSLGKRTKEGNQSRAQSRGGSITSSSFPVPAIQATKIKHGEEEDIDQSHNTELIVYLCFIIMLVLTTDKLKQDAITKHKGSFSLPVRQRCQTARIPSRSRSSDPNPTFTKDPANK